MGLGDDIMLTAEARRLHEKHGKPASVGGNEWSPVWENNPHICKSGGPKTSSSIGKRPYIKGWDAARLYYDENHRPEHGEIYFSDEENRYRESLPGGFVMVEPHVKGTFGGNKAWIWDRWVQLAQALPVVQCLPPGKRPLPGATVMTTPTIRHAMANLSKSALLITTDGALHHAAAALRIPTIVLWGQRTNPLVLGYPEQINLTAGEPEFCGMMAPCNHCVESMRKITVDQVLDEAYRLLDSRRAVDANRAMAG